jgi:Flp pilus assembly protein protease CpaA
MTESPGRSTNRRDEIEGFRPAVLLAIGLALITSSVAAAVLTIWLLSISAFGGFGDGAAGLIAAVLVWTGFWVGLSLGLAIGLMMGFRAWMALYPSAQRNAAAHQLRAEHRAAIAEVEAVLREAEPANDSRPPQD